MGEMLGRNCTSGFENEKFPPLEESFLKENENGWRRRV